MDALFYSFLTAIATLIGGAIPLFTRVKDIGSRYLIGFASGTMISAAFFEMLPEAGIASNAKYLGLGFFLLYLMERVVMIHACGEEECESHPIGWVSIIGIGLESIVDGIAIAVGFAVNAPLGLAITFAIMSHEIPSGFRTAVIMKHARYTMSAILLAVAIDAFFAPLGTVIASIRQFPVEPLLAFTAGTFLYIGASDLLPEAHKRFNYKVIFSVFLGAASIIVIEALAGGVI